MTSVPLSTGEVYMCVLEAADCVVCWEVSGGLGVVWLWLSGYSGSPEH